METNQKRIEHAWSQCKDWIAAFDGSPSETFLINVPFSIIPMVLPQLAAKTENFRVSVIPNNQPELAEFIALDLVEAGLQRLIKGEIAELHVNYAVRMEAFDLDLHCIIDSMDTGNASLEFFWWIDQVFMEETDFYEQFKTLMAYFIELQTLFQAATLLVSQEIGTNTGEEIGNGVEI